MGYFDYGISIYSNPLTSLLGPFGYLFPIRTISYMPYRDYNLKEPLFKKDYGSLDYTSSYKTNTYRPYRNSVRSNTNITTRSYHNTNTSYNKNFTENEGQVKKSTNVIPKESKNGTCRPKAGVKLGKDFLEAVKGVAERVQCDYKDLLAVMYAESALNPAAVNEDGGATGLIQFMPKTAREYGTTTEELEKMSAIEQLPYVEAFLKRAKKRRGFEGQYLSAGDLYALVFLPARSKREVLCVKGESYYRHNKSTDLNKDEKITKSELVQRMEDKRVDESIFV